MNHNRFLVRGTILIVLLLLAFSLVTVYADGTETLGTPSIGIASGSGIVAAGTGLETQPGNININVPAGATVNQVLLYWSNEFYGTGDDTVTVDGNPVTGTSIGGPTVFYHFNGSVELQSFRADITGLGLVGPGANTLAIAELDPTGLGAGVLVIFDDGSTADIQVLDGSDLAYYEFASPLDTTVPQTFIFAAEGSDRIADLVIFAGSVGGADRPNAIDITVDGETTTLVNPLGSFDGSYWDTFTVPVTIPAGATSLTVQVLSQGDGTGNQPASLEWVGAVLSVPVSPPGGEGCTPGYWKQPHHLEDWAATGLSPDDDFDTTFGVDYFDPDITLFEAVNAKGGGVNKVARHGTAALLNVYQLEVEYPLTAAEVIAAVQAGDVDGLVGFNELTAPGFCD